VANAGHQTRSCSACGYVYTGRLKPPCPDCGATAITFELTLTSRVTTLDSLQGKQRRPGFAGALVSFTERTKLSALGNLARESLRLDRSDPEKTVKTHRVEERQEDGSWTLEHNEREEYPAKRRPTDTS
jgi:hypothetical protein